MLHHQTYRTVLLHHWCTNTVLNVCLTHHISDLLLVRTKQTTKFTKCRSCFMQLAIDFKRRRSCQSFSWALIIMYRNCNGDYELSTSICRRCNTNWKLNSFTVRKFQAVSYGLDQLCPVYKISIIKWAWGGFSLEEDPSLCDPLFQSIRYHQKKRNAILYRFRFSVKSSQRISEAMIKLYLAEFFLHAEILEISLMIDWP